MSDKISRRDIFTKEILRLFFNLGSTKTLSGEDLQRNNLEQYFRSPIHSYPLLQEMPWDLLITEAEMRGIPVEGRDKNAIARDIFLKVNNKTI
jgi:hypothetical protein